MADFINSSDSKRRTVSLRIDLTPMVDLGFLLIAFFMFTTTLTESRAMDITMPDKQQVDNDMVYPEESTVTFIPVSNSRIWYYTGRFIPGKLKTLDISAVRNFLLDKKQEVAMLPGNYSAEAHQLHVILKPDDCNFQDMVSLLDEMNITAVPYYTIADLSIAEQEAINQPR